MTPKRLRVLRYIFEYKNKTAYMPTFREVGVALGISSTTVFEHCLRLHKEGYLRRIWAESYARNMRLTEKAYNILGDCDVRQNM